MKRDRQAGRSRTPLVLASRILKSQSLDPPRQAAWFYLFIFLIGLPSVVFLLTCSETCLWIFFFLFVWSLKISWMRGGLFILHPLRCCEFSALEKVRRRPMSLRLKFSQLSAVDQPRLSQIAATMTNYYGHFLILALQPSFFFPRLSYLLIQLFIDLLVNWLVYHYRHLWTDCQEISDRYASLWIHTMLVFPWHSLVPDLL